MAETRTPHPSSAAAGGLALPRSSRARGMLTDWKLRLGLIIVGLFALIGLVGPLLIADVGAISDEALHPPSSNHLLGTTQTGQDVFGQLVYATRGSLIVGLVVGVLATVLSVLVGVVGGYLGGRIDEALSLISNVVLVIPSLPLVILITNYLDGASILTIALIISITSWAASARVLRAQTMSVRSRDYVDAARAMGERTWRVILVEILPNLLPVIASQFVFAIIFAILTEAGLSFLGLGGIDYLTWGTMLYFAQNAQALALGAWWWFIPPGLAIALVGAGLSLINFSFDELINPRLRVPKSIRSARSASRKRRRS
ncbi:ABC transporter permease [Actinoalloteichus hymeniacidonis]|uniref:ABC-type dipeptide/oligopeptide/nickel transport system, permease component n=1 Tax=Actinoalloteichus hymeniacidonis TaxID=340345 RepID=A0AAC9MWU3_9PSEU|nr:ABC transporter permease [Actinoalloteichus hymeniacidonis]AOS62578.1 ABC-type dipeptide/oligopeptide/nickel transport system, permease component [Actinoalloteichus hymeniacidonis]MBB5909391.1 peptide/nickel transport system permease protein [Actinoalloteichus hymeniacidonis]